MSTPIFDELEEKWNFTDHYRAMCDEYWTVTHLATGQVWYEDDEGNEVFPGVAPTLEELDNALDLHAYLVPQDVKVGDVVRQVEVGEPIVYPKRKFKLLGRNQGTNGTL